MAFTIISAGGTSLRLILGIQPQNHAHLIECHVDSVRMNLNSCDHGTKDGTQPLRIEILPTGCKPCRLVQKPLLGNRAGPMTLK